MDEHSDNPVTPGDFDTSPRQDGRLKCGFVRFDENHECVHVNSAATDILGAGRTELLGQSVRDVFPVPRDVLSDLFGRVRENGDLVEVERYIDEVKAWWELEAYPSDSGISVVFQDISETKQREKQLRDSQEAYENVFHGIDDSVFVHEVNGAIVAVNDSARDRLGYSEAELLEMTPADLDASEHAQMVDKRLEDVQRDGTLRFETVHITKSGERIPVEITASLIQYFGSERVLSVARDISKRKEQEQKLRRMKRAVDASGHAVYITDADGLIEYVNPAFEETTGYSRDEVIGENPRILNSGEMSDDYFEELWECILSGNVWEEEITNRRKDGDLYHAHQTVAPISDGDNDVDGFVAIQTDISQQKRRERKLEKRERLLRELHTDKRALLTADTKSEVFEEIADAISRVTENELSVVLQFDEDDGVLRRKDRSPNRVDGQSRPPVVEPGENPLWEVFLTGDAQAFSNLDARWIPTTSAEPASNLLAVPVGDFGLILVIFTDGGFLESIDGEFVELLATNAEAVLGRIEGETRIEAVSENLVTQESRIHELENLINLIDRIQRKLTEADTKESLQTAVCEELVTVDSVDLAWVGQPGAVEHNLTPTAVAGSYTELLDLADPDDGNSNLPSQRAAIQRRPISVEDIPAKVAQEGWAKNAVSHQLQSVYSIPLLFDDVLYGVLTLYSTEKAEFDTLHKNLFEQIGTVVANYLSILNIQFAETGSNVLEIELDITDSNYPLHVLADQTGSTLQFQTVLETLDDFVRILVAVSEGDVSEVLAKSGEMTSIRDVTQFGDPEGDQLEMVVQKPFLASEVAKHGGRLVESVASPQETSVRITLPNDISVRQLVESLANRYTDMELVARRETREAAADNFAEPDELLTDRQREILRAAYHGGYYESPRGVSGEDLASSFDLSNSVIGNHLRAAHKRILGQIFESNRDNHGRNS